MNKNMNNTHSKVYIIVVTLDSGAADLHAKMFYGMIGNYLLRTRLVTQQDDLAFIDLKYKTPQETFAMWQLIIKEASGQPTYIFLDYDNLKPAQVHVVMRFFEQACVTVAPQLNPLYQTKTVWRAETLHNTFTIDPQNISPLLTPKMMEEAMRQAMEEGTLSNGA